MSTSSTRTLSSKEANLLPTFPIPSLPSLSQPLQGVVPPNVNLVNPDPVFQGSFLPTAAAASKPMRAVMSNSTSIFPQGAHPLSPSTHPSFPKELTPTHPSFPKELTNDSPLRSSLIIPLTRALPSIHDSPSAHPTIPPHSPLFSPTLTPLSPHAHPSFPSRSPLFPLTLTPLSPHAHPSFPPRSPLFPLTLTPLSPHAHPSFPSRSPLFPLTLTPLSPNAHPSFSSRSPLFPLKLTPLSPHAHPSFPPRSPPLSPHAHPLFPPTLTPLSPRISPIIPPCPSLIIPLTHALLSQRSPKRSPHSLLRRLRSRP
ncbi:unnamed protein product [Closterium sp. NIES-65]|nr:unnamed protein product [Closterium sp. NIES-65]